MAILAEIFMEVDAIVFNTFTPLLFDDTEILFLKESETADEFEVVFTLGDSWLLEHGEYRQMFRLEVTRSDSGFNAEVVKATHVKIGDLIYIISNADTLPPTGMNSSWKFYCERFTKKSQFSSIY